jgi:hypothetical protein
MACCHESGFINIDLFGVHAWRREIIVPGRLHLECIRVQAYMACYELDSGRGSLKLPRDQSRSKQVH